MTIEKLCEKYWPEGCEAFLIDDSPKGKWFRWYKKGVSEQVAILLDDDKREWIVEERAAWLPVIACVAAMHWTNKSWEQAEHSKDRALCREAVAAWSELAKGV